MSLIAALPNRTGNWGQETVTNHFHLVFETPEANFSKLMHSLSTAYTVYYNRRHRRHGYLLDGRFKAKLVDGDDFSLSHSHPLRMPSQLASYIVRVFPASARRPLHQCAGLLIVEAHGFSRELELLVPPL